MTEALTDAVQLVDHDGVDKQLVHEDDVNNTQREDETQTHAHASTMAYLARCRANMTKFVTSDFYGLKIGSLSKGYYMPSCFIHTGFTNEHGPFISGLSYIAAFWKWYDAQTTHGKGNVRMGWIDDAASVPLLAGNCSQTKSASGVDVVEQSIKIMGGSNEGDNKNIFA